MKHKRSKIYVACLALNKLLTFYRLSKSRRKRPVPKGWTTSETIEKFGDGAVPSKPLYPGATSLAVNEAGELVLIGGSNGTAGVYSVSKAKVLQTFEASGVITDAIWYDSQPVISTSFGAVNVFGGSDEINFTSHAGCANALALHPCGDILASVGVDKSFVFYDLVSAKAVTQIYTDSGMFAFF